MPKKVLFIQPFQFVKKNLSNELLMWFIYLENYLNARINNIVTDVIYLPAENNVSGDFLSINNLKKIHLVLDNAISKLDFNLDNKTYICISGISFDYLGMKLIAEYLQHNFPESIIVSGGYHASSCPNDFIYSNSPFDYVVIGEGESALYHLISNERKKKRIPTIIEGTPFNRLDDLPPLDITLLDKYIDYIRTQARGLSISLSRGCPHNCSYCIEESLAKGKKIKRWRSYTPKRAVQEINTIINYGLNQDIKYYGFLDPCFGYNKNWLNKFLDLYKVDEEVIHHFVETRIDILNEQLISNLQKKKMFQFYGVETFSKRILGIMNKTHNPTNFLNQLENVIAIHKNLEYKCSFGLISNHPGETRETIQESFTYLSNIAEKDNNDLFNFVPILYHLFAKTANYEKLEILNQRYGTKVYFPEWWKDMRTLKLGAFAIRPSSHLSLRDSINLFVEKHLEIDRYKYEKNKKEGFGLFLAKTSILKKQRNELIKFLDENNIEMEEPISTLV
ncbi:MAG: radical SAM protein [Promethearchaeota archaeon]|nr:MAG: radical SAM protein [Candidatus Lokiarchaeota archaeon]